MSDRPRVLIELGAELDRAARRKLGPKRRRRLTPGAVMVTLGAAVAVVVALVALVAGGHRSQTVSSAGVPSGARQLVAELAVLRRPQTAADRSLPARLVNAAPAIIPSLTRLVATEDLGKQHTRVYLVVTSPQPCRSGGSVPRGGDAVSLIIATPPIGTYGADFTASQLRSFAVTPIPTLATGGREIVASVVPDGVTRVKWTFPPGHAPADHAQIDAISPDTRDNVAVANVLSGERVFIATATWQLADGRVLTSNKERFGSNTCPAPSVVLGAHRQIARSLQEDFMIFRSSRLTRSLALSGSYKDYFASLKSLGLNFAEARFVPTSAGLRGAAGVWVVPGGHGLCLMEGTARQYQGGNGICTSDASRSTSPQSGGARFSVRDGGGRNTYVGLVPDGNPTVAVLLATGAVETVPVVDNVYSFTTRGRAVALIDKNAAGQLVRFALHVNSNMF